MTFVIKKLDRHDKRKNTSTIRHVISVGLPNKKVTTVSTIAKQAKKIHFPFESVIFFV